MGAVPPIVATPEFAALLEAALDAMLVLRPDGAIAQVNAHAERLFGYSRGELIGQAVELLLPERFGVSPPGRPDGHPCGPHDRLLGADLHGRRKDGTEFPAELSLCSIRTTAGVLSIAAIRDGTTRQKTEDRFRRLLDAAPDAMIISDRHGRITLANACAVSLFGHTSDELIGRDIELLIPERYRTAHPGHRAGFFAHPRNRPMGVSGLALFGLRKDGTEFPAEISLSPLETEEGTLAITAIRDITERMQAEAARIRLYQVQEALRLRDEFLSVASHELRTPLAALQMQVDGVLRAAQRGIDEAMSSKMVSRFEVIQRAVDRLNRLIDQLLDLTRIGTGRMTLQREEVDLATALRNVVEQFQDSLSRAGCELRQNLPDGPVLGFWDPLRLEQILTNLVSNAMKYGAGHPIEISLKPLSAGWVQLSVRDHGIGIAPEDQARIFERFERVADPNYGGIGLGLWIVRQLTEAHGGRIRVWSQPGAGSTFTVELPARPTAPVPAPGGQPEQKCLMVIDDDAMLRTTFASVFTDEGYAVVTAVDGQDALEQLRAGLRPSLIFLDWMMPRMDGRTFLSLQQQDPALSSIPVVLLSAATDISRHIAAIGVAGHLRKPVGLEVLLTSVDRLVGRPAAPTAPPPG